MAFALAPDILLHVKIVPPVLGTGLCERPRLLDRVQRGELAPLTLVRAPAGYGKTTLLQQAAALLQGRGEAVAWLSFDRSDNQVRLALAYLVAAFGQVHPAINERLAGRLERLREGEEVQLIAALLRALEQWAQPMVLILDDLHHITAPALQECLRFLVNHAPAQLRCVFASRESLPWEAERLARPAATEVVDAGSLRFTTAETAQLLNEVRGHRLDDAAVHALAEKTEGWIAGIQLFASSLTGPAPPLALAGPISGSNAILFEYLASAVLQGQSEELASFLMRTAPLRRFTAELCQHVTGNAGAHRLLARLERENLFLVPLDASRQWYRYHTLFAEFLVARLQREQPGELPAIHRAASRWFQSGGRPMEAMEHALAADDPDQIAALLDGAARQSLRHSQLHLLFGWLDHLPPDAILRAGINATLAVIWAYISCRQLDRAEALIGQVRSILDGAGPPPAGGISPKDRPCLELATIALERLRDPDQDNTARLEAVRARLGANWNLERALADIELGHVHWRRNELEQAYVAMLESRAQAEASGYYFLTADILSFMADIRWQQGRLGDSRRLCEELIGRFPQQQGDTIPATGFAWLILAELDFEQNRSDAAWERLRVAVALNRERNSPDLILRGQLLAARIEASALDPAAQAEHLLQLSNSMIHEGRSEVASRLYSQQACALARARQLPAAQALLEHHGLPVTAAGPRAQLPISAADEPLYFALGCYHLAAGHHAPALAWFRALLQWSQRSGRQVSQARVLALLALTYAAQERVEDALRTLREALALGARLGLARSLAELGQDLQRELRQFCSAREEQDRRRGTADPLAAYAQQLLALATVQPAAPAAGADPGAAAPGTAGGTEPLTRRELEILRLVNEGLSNQDIADELLIAPTSVKWHLKNIFSKLYVSSRTQAIARAREARIIG